MTANPESASDDNHGPASASDGMTTSKDDRAWAMLSHLTIHFLPVVGPLAIRWWKGRESAFARREATEALNFQLAAIMAGVAISGLATGAFHFAYHYADPLYGWKLMLAVLILSVPWLIVLVVLAATWSIIAMVRTSKGQAYRYPLSLRLFRG